jgi:hypothetical protein
MEHGSRASIAKTRQIPFDACISSIGDGHRCSLVFTFSCVLFLGFRSGPGRED